MKQSNRDIESVYEKYWNLFTFPYQLLKSAVSVARGGAIGPPQTEFKVLRGIDGHIAPSKMTLILSPPGHGKSAFLKALASLLPAGPLLSGQVQYGGLTKAEAEAQGIHIGHVVQYVDQLDQHLPYLTVRETFDFIHENALIDPTLHGHPELAAAHRTRVDDTLALLSLTNCAETVVGNDLLRGISGGEKKRVTVGESLLTNARVLLMDEISTGLDAAVTFDIVHSLRRRAQLEQLAVVIALLQPTPEVYALFDEVILMREGQVVYHGPRDQLPAYLAALGFEVPAAPAPAPKEVTEETVVIDEAADAEAAQKKKDEQAAAAEKEKKGERKEVGVDMADYLSELMFLPHKGLPAAGIRDGAKCPPLTTDELAHEWKGSALYKHQMAAVDAPLKLETPFACAQYGHEYAHSTGDHILSLVKRQFVLMSRNKIFLFMRFFTAIFMVRRTLFLWLKRVHPTGFVKWMPLTVLFVSSLSLFLLHPSPLPSSLSPYLRRLYSAACTIRNPRPSSRTRSRATASFSTRCCSSRSPT